jgi:hypothetical protein
MMVDKETAAADRGIGCRGCYVVSLVELRGSTRPLWLVPLDGTFRVAA